jgi:large subunit ribosomal protein L46
VRAERSLLSDFELQEREIARLRRERERRALEEEVLQESPDQKAVEESDEQVEARDQELSEFQPAPRSTAADQTGDLRSVERQLDKMLYLLVKKNRSSHCWQMPQGTLSEGESLLQAAKRELSEDCGSDLKVDFLSSAPSAFLSYHHPLPSPSGIIGSKVFFLKAQHRGGGVRVSRDQGLEDHVWLTKDEMREYVNDSYYQSVASTLID